MILATVKMAFKLFNNVYALIFKKIWGGYFVLLKVETSVKELWLER